MARPRTFARRLGRPNRGWAGFNSTGFTTVAASSKVLLTSSSPSNLGIDETILRTVGVICVKSDQQAQSEDQLGAFGFIRVTDVAAGIGITAVPGPVTDTGDDGWYVYVPFTNHFKFLTAAGVDTIGSNIIQFDSKAKRRVEDGTTLAVVVENASASHGFQIVFAFRCLSMTSRS